MSILKQFSDREQAILKMRAERIARSAEDDQMVEVINALTVSIQNEIYALPNDTLTGVYEAVKVVPVPCTPSYVSGIANLRGLVVPVLNLAHLLNLSVDFADDVGTLIVVNNDRLTLAFRVMAVGDMVTLLNSDISAMQNKADDNYIQGVLPDGTALINVHAILDDSRLVVNNSISG